MMKRMRGHHLRLGAAAGALAVLAAPLHAGNTWKKFAGNWKGETYARGETREQSHEGAYAIRHHTIELSLGDDGSATVTESPDAVSASTRFGRWNYADGRITVTFAATQSDRGTATPNSAAGAMGAATQTGAPLPSPPSEQNDTAAALVFAVRRGELTPVAWDHTRWGNAGPPTLHRE